MTARRPTGGEVARAHAREQAIGALGNIAAGCPVDGSFERCSDDDLRAVESGNPDPRARSAAAELLVIRSERRRDSRRAEQIKKVRWAVENAITKIEQVPDLLRRWQDEDKPNGQRHEQLMVALAESVKLQSHYAALLNSYDGGERMVFVSPGHWMARLEEVARQAAQGDRANVELAL